MMKTSVAIVKGKYASRLLDTVWDMVGAEKLISPRDKVKRKFKLPPEFACARES